MNDQFRPAAVIDSLRRVADGDGSGGKIDILPLQRTQFSNSKTGVQRQQYADFHQMRLACDLLADTPQFIFGKNVNIDAQTYQQMRGKSYQEVLRTNGQISFPEVLRQQSRL